MLQVIAKIVSGIPKAIAKTAQLGAKAAKGVTKTSQPGTKVAGSSPDALRGGAMRGGDVMGGQFPESGRVRQSGEVGTVQAASDEAAANPAFESEAGESEDDEVFQNKQTDQAAESTRNNDESEEYEEDDEDYEINGPESEVKEPRLIAVSYLAVLIRTPGYLLVDFACALLDVTVIGAVAVSPVVQFFTLFSMNNFFKSHGNEGVSKMDYKFVLKAMAQALPVVPTLTIIFLLTAKSHNKSVRTGKR